MNQVQVKPGLLDYEKVSKSYNTLRFLQSTLAHAIIRVVSENEGINQTMLQFKMRMKHQSQVSVITTRLERLGILDQTNEVVAGDWKSYHVNHDRIEQINRALSNFSRS